MKKTIIAMTIALLLTAPAVFAIDTTSVDITTISTSHGLALGDISSVQTWDNGNVTASIIDKGNAVSGWANGFAQTFVVGHGLTSAESGVATALHETLSATEVLGQGVTEQYAKVNVPGSTSVNGQTYFYGRIDPVRIAGTGEAYGSDYARAMLQSLGGADANVWLKIALEYNHR
jgi:hypothetical protein